MLRLKINYTIGDKRRIDNAVSIRPLKSIRFDRVYDWIQIKETKPDAFKGLKYKNLIYGATIASRYLFQKHPALKAGYKAS
jgi:hypothetical protein